MNSTRTSKSRDATSLHPVTKSGPFDLSTAPQSYAHLLLQTKIPRVKSFNTLNQSTHLKPNKKLSPKSPKTVYLLEFSIFRRIELGFRRIDGEIGK